MKRKEFLKQGVFAGISAMMLPLLSNISGKNNEEKKRGLRGIEGILSPANTHMVGNGFKVMNYFPNGKGFEERMSPFFLLDFNAEVHFPPSDLAQGVGVHPHRGIETITFAYKGAVEHHDSKGNHGIIHSGDIQWMTAGGGVLHKEYHEQTFNRSGGAFEMLQLWINLPAKYKMTPAKYQSISHTEKPKVVLSDGKSHLFVIAGEYQGVKGIASTFSPIIMYDVHLEKDGTVELNLPANYNSGILVVDGSITINEKIATENKYIQLKNEAGKINIRADKRSLLIVLSGEPLNEPYVNYGPFVMNTEDEIRQAIEDYNNGKFGFLED